MVYFSAVGSSWAGLLRAPDGTKLLWADGTGFDGDASAVNQKSDVGCHRFDGNSGDSFHHEECARTKEVICQHVCGNMNKGKRRYHFKYCLDHMVQ